MMKAWICKGVAYVIAAETAEVAAAYIIKSSFEGFIDVGDKIIADIDTSDISEYKDSGQEYDTLDGTSPPMTLKDVLEGITEPQIIGTIEPYEYM